MQGRQPYVRYWPLADVGRVWRREPILGDWSAKLEYLYVGLATHSINTLDVDGAPFHVETKLRNHIVRVGLNYKPW